ncbi:MAG TPA: 6-carboxytetrahydropterin synthase [Gemmatimonadales bacterium]|nr:6-carboxytetrahydropterin synthase [Gemmatimonadales bacterium]
MGTFQVRVAKEDLVFAAAHFITLAGHRCESLHGHNYRAGIVVEGELEPETWFVFDFVALKRLMKGLTDELDHRVLLPTTNPKLTVRTVGDRVRVAYEGEERYAFPTRDCVLLPIPNTTVEELARYLTGRVKAILAQAGVSHLSMIELEVEENFGQSASYRETM